MPVWEYELFMEELNKAIKEDNKRNKEEEDKYNVNDMRKMAERRNIDRMSNDAYKNIPKMPGIPSTSGQLPRLPSMSSFSDV